MIELMTIEELARYLKCSAGTIANMRKARQLPKPILRGGTPLWRSDEVLEVLSEQRMDY